MVLNDAGVQNQLSIVADRWKIASAAREPVLFNGPFGMIMPWVSATTSRYLFDGSFVKIRNINLAYSLPAKIYTG